MINLNKTEEKKEPTWREAIREFFENEQVLFITAFIAAVIIISGTLFGVVHFNEKRQAAELERTYFKDSGKVETVKEVEREAESLLGYTSLNIDFFITLDNGKEYQVSRALNKEKLKPGEHVEVEGHKEMIEVITITKYRSE